MQNGASLLAVTVDWIPAVGIAVGFPLLLLVLSEAVVRSTRRGWAVTRTLRSLRSLVVPALAVLLFVRFVIGVPREDIAVRLAETVFWILLLYTLLGVINDLVFGGATRQEPGGAGSWRARVPKLFRDLARALLVGVGALLVYKVVWGGEIQGALTALGLGSIVIGLALQEPLGNIVSGLMLLFERPLNVGDWIIAEGVTGRVIEINWRSVHIETPTRELLIIPNVSLYKDPFTNLSRPTTMRTEVIEMGFSYDDPPNRVKEVMQELLEGVPGILRDPAPVVRTAAYADFSITYRLVFSVATPADLPVARDAVMTRMWYAVRRAGLTIPFPTALEFGPGESPGPAPRTAAGWLEDHPRFKGALEGGDEVPVIDYTAGETVQNPGRAFHGFALVLSGRAVVRCSAGADGGMVDIGEIVAGECFGDELTAGGWNDDIAIVAAEDLKVMVFDSAVARGFLDRSPALAEEIGNSIEVRRQAVMALRCGG